MTRSVSRRRLLAGAAAVAAAPMFVPSRLLGDDAPSNRIALGFIGVGTHGHGYNLKSFLQQKDAHAVAVCDVYASRRDRAVKTINDHYKTTGCKQYADFRDLLADKSIDAVCISTPDHWHVPLSMAALSAGKDVMCEKPTLTIAEGRTLVDHVAKAGRVFAVGLEDRSVIYYHKLAEFVRNGAIGKLHTIRVKLPAGENFPKEEPVPVPAGLDWNMWLGPAPFAPFTPTRTGPQQWRNIYDYSGGKFTDWGSHLLDTAQVANFSEKSSPVEATGSGEIPSNAMTTRPVTYKLHYRYANGVEMHVESGGISLRFEGDAGWVGNNGWRGRLEASDDKILHTRYEPGQTKLWLMPPTEHRNFLDCVKSRQTPTYSAEDLQRLSTTMHIGNIATELGRTVKWDPKTESFVNDAAADKLRSRESRNWQA
ncbi:Gfo/Idh/MocA family oxidoreductase [Planctomycetales bacterium ZRK34]|nr:Gfo/Idh/MocA family oxidoreductase [Planctomycetales bacterium ZRK34]